MTDLSLELPLVKDLDCNNGRILDGAVRESVGGRKGLIMPSKG